MNRQIKYLKDERTHEDILKDVCEAFGQPYHHYVNMRKYKTRSTEIDALISMAFCLIMRRVTFLSHDEIGKLINRGRSSVSQLISKGNYLLESDNSFADKFKVALAKSSPEGLKLFI